MFRAFCLAVAVTIVVLGAVGDIAAVTLWLPGTSVLGLIGLAVGLAWANGLALAATVCLLNARYR